MMTRQLHSSAYNCAIGRIFPLLFAVVGIGALCADAAAQLQILRWEIEGTVIDIGDSDMIFSNVRLGDPVRGFIRYDLATPPDVDDPNDVVYEHALTFEVARMVIENPRDGSEINFVADQVLFADIEVINDGEAELVGQFDYISATQSVVPPDGFTGFFPVVGVDLFGPPDSIVGTSLPVTLELNDWPNATIYFVNLLDLLSGFKEPVASYVAAEIHTLTPVVLPPVPGDFNANGKVDAGDYVVWRDGLGSAFTEGDYDVWKSHFGQTAGDGTGLVPLAAASANFGVPEPGGVVLAAAGAVLTGGLALRRRRRHPSRFRPLIPNPLNP